MNGYTLGFITFFCDALLLCSIWVLSLSLMQKRLQRSRSLRSLLLFFVLCLKLIFAALVLPWTLSVVLPLEFVLGAALALFVISASIVFSQRSWPRSDRWARGV